MKAENTPAEQDSQPLHPLAWFGLVSETPLMRARSTPTEWRYAAAVIAMNANGRKEAKEWRRNGTAYQMRPGEWLATRRHIASRVWPAAERLELPALIGRLNTLLRRLRDLGWLKTERLEGYRDGCRLILTTPPSARILDPKPYIENPISAEQISLSSLDLDPTKSESQYTQNQSHNPISTVQKPLNPLDLDERISEGHNPIYLGGTASKGPKDIEKTYRGGEGSEVFKKVFEKAYSIEPDVDPIAEVWGAIEEAAIGAGFDPDALALWVYGWMRGRRREDATPYAMLDDLQEEREAQE